MADLFGERGQGRDAREHFCECGSRGVYGLGNTWFCRTHVPSGFLPHLWGPRADGPSVCVRCETARDQAQPHELCPGRPK